MMPTWVLGLVFVLFSVGSAFGQATELFFSEYMEGSSNNKALEIYNGTGASVNLANYEVRLYANGATTATTFTLSGTLNDGKVIYIKHSSSTVGPTAAANGNLYLSSTAANAILSFNGDDAIALYKGTTLLDVIGNVGCDPGSGWTSGSYTTVDRTIRRQSTICGGVTTDPAHTGNTALGCPFPTLNTEWDLFALDSWDYGHTASCTATAPEINIKQNTTNLTSGTGTYTFSPSVNVGSSSSAVTFTVENTGSATLNLSGTPRVAISGHTSDFTIDQTSTTATVAATTGTTTFTVTFNPTAGGTRTAVISIANNDSNENPYTFTVTGTGVASTPTLGVSPTSIAFGTVTTNTTSSQNFFTLTSSNLTGNVTITPPTGFEVSTTSGGPYSASAITLTPAQAASVAVYVVFKPTAAISYSGNVAVSGGGATTVNVAVTGTGIAPCVAPANQATSLNLSNITSSSIDGSFTAASGGASGYLVLASTSATAPSNPANGTPYSTIGGAYNGNTTIVAYGASTTFTAGSLTPNTPYYFYVYAYNSTTCTGGPVYRTPALTGTATTLTAPVTIATYTFTGADGNETTWPADATPAGVSASTFARGGIASAPSTATGTNTFISTNFQTSGGTLATNRYVEFTVSATAGYQLTLTGFSFKDQISGTGPSGFALRSNKDSYAANIFSGSTNGTITDPAHTTTLTGYTNVTGSTTFRLYAYGASSASGTWRVDDVTVLGFINATGPTLVATPTTLAFGNVNINTTSTQQSFVLEGINLTNNVTLTAPAGYAISTTNGSGYTGSITLTAVQAAANPTIYVVFQPTATGAQSGNIAIASSGATSISVALTGTGTVPPPAIVTSTTGTLAFGNVNVGTTSTQQSYTVSGTNLTANLVVTAPTNFAVSTTSGGPYTSSVSLAPSSGTVNTTTIYVVYQPTANGAQTGNVGNASTGATTRNVAVSGTGVTPCSTPLNQATNLTFPSIVGTTINGSFTAAVGGADGYLVLRSTSSTLSTGPVDGVAYTIGSTLGGGTVVSTSNSTTFSTSGNPTTTYYFFVYAYNNTGCVGGPLYKKPLLSGVATTLTSLYTAFDNFDRSNGTTAGVPSSGGATAWTEVEGAAARVAIFNNKLVISGGSPAGADAASFNMTGKYATTFNQAQTDLVWIFNMASTRSNPSGFLTTSSTFGTAVVLGGTDADITDAGNGYAVILGASGTPDYVKIVRYTGGLMNPTNNANLTDIVSYTANSADQEILNVKVEYSPTTKIWKLYVNEPGGTASYNTGGTQPSFNFPDPTAATYGTPASSSADNNALLNSALPHSGFLFNHGTASDEYSTFDNFNIPTAQPCQNSWTGATSTDWFTASNWSCGFIPTSTVDVVIPNTSAGSGRYPVVPAGLAAATKGLTINTGASVTINANVIAGFPVSTNDLEVYGNLTNNGSANWGTGTVTLKGSTAQTVSGNNNFQYLTIENANGVSLTSGTQKVFGTLALKAGALTTNGNLTIGSNATYTGLIDEFTTGYTGTISGNITVERYSNNTASSFFYIGAPVGGAQVTDWADDFSTAPMNGAGNGSQVQPTTSCSITNLQAGSPYGGLFDYRESAITFCNLQGWHVRTSGSAPAGQGFLARTPAGNTIDVTGTFVTGTVTTAALTKTNNTSPSPKGMNLLANPYAAPIEWLAVASGNNTKVMGTAYFYQTSGPLAGTYVPVNSTTGGGEIGSSQSFFVEAVSNGVTVNFTNNMKRNGSNSYLRTAPVYEQLLTLDVTGNGFADRTMVAFGADFTPAFDSDFDARKLMSRPEQPSMYVNDGSLKYSIYAQPSMAQVQLVPVDFMAGTNGTFTIAADLSTFDPTAMVYLEDRLLGTMNNLRLNASYTFTATTADVIERFVLHFFPAMATTLASATCATQDGAITFSQPGTTEWNLELLDANGNSVYTNNAFTGTQTVSNLATGTYTLNLVHASGYAVSQTFMISGPQPVTASFVAPAQALEGDDVAFTNAATNATGYSWNFGDGNTSTDADPVHTYAFAGQYTVELVVTNGACQESYSQVITIAEKLVNGVDEVLGGQINMYVYGTDLYITLANLETKSTVDVFDLTGRKVIATTTLEMINGDFVISLGTVVNGYYFVRLSNEKDITTKKVLVNSGK